MTFLLYTYMYVVAALYSCHTLHVMTISCSTIQAQIDQQDTIFISACKPTIKALVQVLPCWSFELESFSAIATYSSSPGFSKSVPDLPLPSDRITGTPVIIQPRYQSANA